MQTQAEYLINRFGGLSKMARALGHTNPTTVQGWKARGAIPPRHISSILSVGAELTPPLTMREFYEGPDGKPHRMTTAAEAA